MSVSSLNEPTKLFTVGYQRRTAADVGSLLSGMGVRTLVDVRDFPGSRKEGFSKKEMAWWLAELAPPVHYSHFRCFGVTKRIRDRYRSGEMPRDEFVDLYDRKLDDQLDDLLRLVGVATASPTALLCFEHDAHTCHRSVLAARLAEFDDIEEVVHL